MRRQRSALRLLIVLGISVAAAPPASAAGVARRVADLNTSMIGDSGQPCGVTADENGAPGSAVIVSGWDAMSGCEIYRSDSSLAGTEFVRELVLGPASSVWGLGPMLGSNALFVGWTPLHGFDLWRTDGTGAGTVMIRDFASSAPWGQFWLWTKLGDEALFFAHEDATGFELWASDGTSPGTRLVRDLEPGPGDVASVWDLEPVVVGSFAYFFPYYAGQLWRSDGTTVGTTQVTDFDPSAGQVRPLALLGIGSVLYFAFERNYGFELWRSDGTPAATTLVRRFEDAHLITPLTALDGNLYFFVWEAEVPELWRSDGTTAGTIYLRSFADPESEDALIAVVAAGPRLYLWADDGVHGTEPWVSDGTAAGTLPLGDLRPGAQGSFPRWSSWLSPTFVETSSGAVIFQVDDGEHGVELWRSNGTPAGTVLLEDLAAGAESSNPRFSQRFGARWIFDASTAEHGWELYATDGTAGGTRRFSDFGGPSSGTWSLTRLTDAAGTLLFAADGADEGTGPYRSDGTEAGTHRLVGDLGYYCCWDLDFEYTPLPNGLTVAHSEGDDTGSLLWSTDGEQILPIGEFVTACGHRWCGVGGFSRAGDVALFGWESADAGGEPWTTDGTPAGTGMLLDIWTGKDSSGGGYGIEVGDDVLFRADDEVHGRELWITSGTPGSTRLLAELAPGPEDFPALDIWPFDPMSLSFFATSQRYENEETWGELWFVPLPDAQTPRAFQATPMLLADDLEPSEMIYLGRVGDRALFRTALKALGPDEPDYELWASDGTPAGTGLVEDINPGPQSSELTRAVRLGDRLYFTACEPITGCELWTSDGTPAGTSQVVELAPGWPSSLPTDLASIDERLYFAACQEATGCEPWVSDGTAAGTHRVADIAPGPASSLAARVPDYYQDVYERPTNFERSGDWIYFPADDTTGTELWAMPIELFYDGFETGDVSRWSEVGEP